MQKIYFISLGCARNLVDSEFALSTLHEAGHEISFDIEGTDIAIVNTCGFIEDAKKESIDVILELIKLKREGKIKKIIVGGCLSQRYSDELIKEMPQIDKILGVNWDTIVDIMKNIDSNDIKSFVARKNVLLPYNKRKSVHLTPAHYSYLKISEGCSHRCSYCAIYKIKGAHKSRPFEDILEEAKVIIQEGVKEINIVAQDTTFYGRDLYKKERLTELINEIAKLAGDFWIRLLYTHPALISDDLISCYKETPKLCKYIDLPLQHINDKILVSMNRNINKAQIVNTIKKLREQIPGLCIRTTFIVGFPSENEEEFKELVAFIEEVKFERLGCFVFSAEDGTAAFDFPSQVKDKEAKKRLNRIMAIQNRIAADFNQKQVGKRMKVLVDTEEKDYYISRSQFDAPEVDGVIYIEKGEKVKVGDFVDVLIKESMEYDLLAEFA